MQATKIIEEAKGSKKNSAIARNAKSFYKKSKNSDTALRKTKKRIFPAELHCQGNLEKFKHWNLGKFKREICLNMFSGAPLDSIDEYCIIINLIN